MHRVSRWTKFLIPLTGGLLAIGVGGGIAAGTAGLDGFWFFLGVAALSIATIGVLIALARRSRDVLSPLGLAAIFYLLGYAVGGVYFWLDPRPSTPLLEQLPFPPTHAALTSAIWIATLAWVTFAIGYWANPLRGFVRAIPRPPSTRSVQSVPLLVAPLLLAGWAARVSLVASGRYFHYAPDEVGATSSSYVIFVITSLPLVATAFVGAHYYLNRREHDAKRYRNAFVILATIELLWALPSGTRGLTVGVLMMLVVVGYYGTPRIPVKALVTVTILVVFVVFPFGLYYRNDSTDYRLAPERAFSSAASKTFDRPVSDVAADGFVATFSRFSDVASLAEIVSRKPSYSSRAPGETLVWTVEGLVPRAILHSKADPGKYGNEFGRTYGLNTPNNFITSIAVTQPGELYMNFGVPALLLMLAVGAAYRAIADYLGTRGVDPGVLAIYAALSWPILSSHEVILANGLVGVLKMLVALSVALGLAVALTTSRFGISFDRGHGSPSRASTRVSA
jgi:hypothetical protein